MKPKKFISVVSLLMICICFPLHHADADKKDWEADNGSMYSYELSFLIVLCAIWMLCTSCNERPMQNGVVTVDVTKSYPKKELILQDFMDVEYVALESSDEFLCQGFVQDVTDKHILVRNFSNTGDAFVFDRQGKGVAHFNHKGQSGEEYVFLKEMICDEEKEEIYVNDLGKKLQIYDLNGNYKRSIHSSFSENTIRFNNIKLFYSDHLICYDSHVSNDGDANLQGFMTVSKEDGSAQIIQLPLKRKVLTCVIEKREGITWGARPQTEYNVVPTWDSWLLTEPSSDTIYTVSENLELHPFLVREPSVLEMDQEVFLFPTLITPRYYFMDVVTKEFDFNKNKGYPEVHLVYDTKADALFECTVYNSDYTTMQEAKMNYVPLNKEVVACHVIPAHELVEDYEKGHLTGRLKEIASKLNEESNPVLMFYKQKNTITGIINYMS